MDYQKSMVERMQAEGQVVQTVELATGHCPNLTMTQEVVNIGILGSPNSLFRTTMHTCSPFLPIRSHSNKLCVFPNWSERHVCLGWREQCSPIRNGKGTSWYCGRADRSPQCGFHLVNSKCVISSRDNTQNYVCNTSAKTAMR